MQAQQPVGQPAGVSRWFWSTCVVVWLVFGAVLLIDSSLLVDLWHGVLSLPLSVQVVAWIVFLPWMVGLWIWNLDWGAWLRLAMILLVAVAGAIVFYPRRWRLP